MNPEFSRHNLEKTRKSNFMKIRPKAAERPQTYAFDRTATGIGQAASTDCIRFPQERKRKLQTPSYTAIRR